MPSDSIHLALSAAKVRTISATGLYADGNGLNLKVDPSGAKRWVQRVTIDGKRHNLGLGRYPSVSLAEARQVADDNQRAIRQGRNPLAEKRQSELERRRPSTPTFAQAAQQVIDLRRPTWSSNKHAAQWASTLATYVYPAIGSKKVDEVASGDVLRVLTPIWTAKPETASRVRQRIETVFDWVVAQGWRSDNPAGKAVLRALPRHSRVKNHYEALNYSKVPEAVARVRECNADLLTRLSFEFLVLTATRSGEVRLATWSEIDEESRTWTIPAERMKARREHRVPLSRRAVEILVEARQLGGEASDLIFPSCKKGKPLSQMTFTSLLRRLEIRAVPHGFRSSFKDWCSEQMGDGYEIASEMALAHNVGNATRCAYSRTELLGPRRVLMEAWGEYIL